MGLDPDRDSIAGENRHRRLEREERLREIRGPGVAGHVPHQHIVSERGHEAAAHAVQGAVARHDHLRLAAGVEARDAVQIDRGQRGRFGEQLRPLDARGRRPIGGHRGHRRQVHSVHLPAPHVNRLRVTIGRVDRHGHEPDAVRDECSARLEESIARVHHRRQSQRLEAEGVVNVADDGVHALREDDLG